MTKNEGAIISAYTRIMIGSFNDFHAYAEKKDGETNPHIRICPGKNLERTKRKNRNRFFKGGQEFRLKLKLRR